MAKIYEGKRILVKMILNKRGKPLFYYSKTVVKPRFRRISNRRARRAIGGIRAYKTRTSIAERERELREIDRRMEVSRGLELVWFVGRTSQPPPTGYIIVMGGFPRREWRDSDIVSHAESILGISFMYTSVLDAIPANYTYIYDIEGHNVTKITIGSQDINLRHKRVLREFK